MPKKAVARKKAPAKKRKPRKKMQQGEGFGDFLKGVNNFLKKTHLVSGIAGALSAVPGVGEFAGPIAGVASSLGYGKKRKGQKRRMVGKGFGSGLNLPGKGMKLIQVPQVKPYR